MKMGKNFIRKLNFLPFQETKPISLLRCYFNKRENSVFSLLFSPIHPEAHQTFFFPIKFETIINHWHKQEDEEESSEKSKHIFPVSRVEKCENYYHKHSQSSLVSRLKFDEVNSFSIP